MATFRISVLEHQKRRDNKYPVSICVTHNRKKAYISTGYYVDKSKISRNFELRDNLILSELLDRIEMYEKKFISLGLNADRYSARELADFVSAKSGMDFLEYFENYVSELKLSKKSIGLYYICYNHLKRFKGDISILEITTLFLCSFLEYLQKANVGKRGQQYYMVLLKAVYRDAINIYRKKTGEYIDDAYDGFVIPDAPAPRKRNISADKIRELICVTELLPKHEFARDVFLISFLLCGTNTVDLFGLEKEKDGRISYYRTKTAGRRKDNAFISYKIEPELRVYLEKYAGKEKAFDFSERYKNSSGFNAKVNDWLKYFVEPFGLPLDFSTYYARHSWATIARNRCGISKDDIAACLNHATRVVTDDYIELDHSVIDNANRKITDFVFKNNSFP